MCELIFVVPLNSLTCRRFENIRGSVTICLVLFYTSAELTNWQKGASSSMETTDVQKGASTSSSSVTMAAAFEKRKAAQPSKAKLEKLRATLQNLRWVSTVDYWEALSTSVLL